MKFIVGKITLLILVSTFISCNGQVKNEKPSLDVEKVSKVNIIPVPENGFSNGYVDKDGTLWFTSNGGGVYHFDGKTFKNYTEKNGLSSNQVFSIVSDHKNNLWFGTQNGLVKYNRKQFEHIPLPYQDTTGAWLDKVYPVINPNAVHSLATDNNNNLWIGTAGGGAYRYDGKNFKSYLTEIGQKQEDSLYHNWIPFIRKDNNGNMWFASMTHGGVNRFDGKEFTPYLIKDGLSDNQVRTIFCDKSGKIWIGFNGNRNSGLTVYDGNSFKTYSVEDGLCNKRIRAIFEDKNGNLWLGADLGNLCVFDGQKFSEFNYNGQTFSDVLFIFADLEDNIWFGGRNGIWKYDGHTVTENPTKQENTLQIGEYVVETFQDAKGNLWFGTLEEGVAKYDGNKLVYHTIEDGLPSNRIVNIIEDASGNLWFGTGAGLSKFDGKTFTNYSEKDGLCSDMISNLLMDSQGTFWIGTWSGVCKFDGTRFENFPIPYPVVETKINQDTKDWITEIAEDKKGNIWFGRDGYGASKFDGNSFVHFTTKNGLNSNNVQSIVEDEEGNIWIGTRVAEKDHADPNKRFGQGGLNKYTGEKFIHFPAINGFNESDVFTIYKDNSNDLWFSTTSNGVYKRENNEFVNYIVPNSTMSFLKDQTGNIWLGCAGGLYRINSNGEIVNITTNGPWN